MAQKTRRVPAVATATFLLLIVSFTSTPSQPSVPEMVTPPDPQEIALLEELAAWLSGYPGGDGDFHLLAPEADLLSAIRDRHQSFELFRHYNPTEERRKLLVGVPYGDAIYRAARRYGLDSLLLAAIVEAESSFNPRVISPQGAVGLTQVLPTSDRNLTVEDLQDPETNLDRGAHYLRWLLDQYQGDLGLALAAYNAGPGNVARYGGVPPFRETRAYVHKVLGIYLSYHQDAWVRSGASDPILFQ